MEQAKQKSAFNLAEWNEGKEVRVLVVDVDPSTFRLVKRVFNGKGCSCVTTPDPHKARELLTTKSFDIVFCDVKTSSGSGNDFAKELLDEYPETAIVMITGADDPAVACAALQIGAHGYMVKPFQVGEMLTSTAGVLRRRTLEMRGALRQETLERRVLEESLKAVNTLDRLKEAFDGVTEAMGLAIEVRDPSTAGHQKRVSEIAGAISLQLGLPRDQNEGIRVAGLIHDIGKIAVPAEILAKPFRLSDEEFILVKEHPRVGYEILKNIRFPWPIAEAVYQHHERLDGSGYPHGLLAEEILIEAKILAVADVVEAISSHRPYRPAFGVRFALDEITRKQGLLYDRAVVAACKKAFEKGAFSLNVEQEQSDSLRL